MWADILTKPPQGQQFRDMQAFIQNCAKDCNKDVKIKKLMKPRSITSSRKCVGEHTKSLLKSRAASPTCVSHITNNLPGRKNVNPTCSLTEGCKRILFTPHRSVNGSCLLTKRKNKLRTFPVNSNFPVRRTRELTHGKNNESSTKYQPHDFPVPSKGQTNAEREFGGE
jgi:hypothetical protein